MNHFKVKIQRSFVCFLVFFLIFQSHLQPFLLADNLQTLTTSATVRTTSLNESSQSVSLNTSVEPNTSQTFLSQTLSLTSPEMTVQAESSSIQGAGWWNSGTYIRMWNNGEISSQQDLESGVYEIEVWANGVRGAAAPQIQMRVDGRSYQATQEVGNVNWQFEKHVFSGVELEGGLHKIAAAFVNDGPGEFLSFDKIVIRKTGELPAVRQVLEGEKMTASGQGVWNGGSYEMLWADGEIFKNVEVQPGLYELDVFANGQSLDAVWPQLNVKVEGMSLQKFSVDKNYWAFGKYTVPAFEIPSGDFKFSLEFTNQAFGRMLSIDQLVLRKVGDIVPQMAEGEQGAAESPSGYLPLGSTNKNPEILTNTAKEFIWVNYDDPATISWDVTGDGIISPADALNIIDRINAFRSGPVRDAADKIYDVTGDNFIAPNDALTVINFLNAEGKNLPDPQTEILDWTKAFPSGLLVALDNGGSSLTQVTFEAVDIFGKKAALTLTGITSSQKQWAIAANQLTGIDVTKVKTFAFLKSSTTGQVLNVQWGPIPAVLTIVSAIPQYATNANFTVGYTVDGVQKQKVFTLAEGANALTLTDTNPFGQTASKSFNITLDSQPPTGSIKINQDAAFTASPDVTLTLTASDATSGVSQIRFSLDEGTTWTAWQSFAASKNLTLPAGDGLKTVKYQIHDKAGNTQTFSDSIFLDLTAPSGTLSINLGATQTPSAAVTLKLSATDGSGSGLDKMSFSENGSDWSTPEDYSASKDYMLSSGDGNKKVYVRFLDKVGNTSVAINQAIILDTTPPAGTIKINGEDTQTNLRDVVLTLTATDVTTGIDQVRYSLDQGATWTPYENFSPTKSIKLALANGDQTVLFQIRDKVGNVQTVSDTIHVQLIGPNVVLTSPVPPSKTSNPVLGLAYTSDNVAKLKIYNLNQGLNHITLLETDALGRETLLEWNVTLEPLVVPAAPAVVYTQPNDYRLFVRERLADGQLSAPVAWEAKGVAWAPDSIGTPQSALHLEFAKWYQTDIPLMAQMGVNTVRVYHDFGTGPDAFKILDMFYQYGIKVIMTVDSPKQGDNANRTNISTIVDAYKNHPAILMWQVGNEWNLYNYYGKFSDLNQSIQFTEEAAQLIKSLDAFHPVTTAIGDFGALPTVNLPNLVPSIDVWGLNIYRNKSLGKIFQQWSEMSNKPMFIGEFGADAYDHDTSAENQTVQSNVNAGLWDEVYFDLSAERIHGRTIGGIAFEWNDEWWKNDGADPNGPNIHNTSSEPNGGQPDKVNDEEWFGIVDINRKPRSVYQKLQNRYWGGAQTVVVNPNPILKVTSLGASGEAGTVTFSLDDKTVFYNKGSQNGARGVTVTIMDPNTGIRTSSVQTFDTWTMTNGIHAAMLDLVNYLKSIPDGTIVSLAVGDEGGFKNFGDTALWDDSLVQQAVAYLESLGSTQIRNIHYNGAWAMIYKKGSGVLAEGVSPDKITEVTLQVPLSLTLNPDFDRRTSTVAPAILEILTPIPAATANPNFEVSYKIDGIQKKKSFTLQEGNNSLSINETNVYGQISTYSFNIILDRMAPVGTISIINDIYNNQNFTSRTFVSLASNFSDAESGLSQMRSSGDGGSSWSAWFDYGVSIGVDLPFVEGNKQMIVQVSDKAGNVASASANIVLDITPPIGSVKINNDAPTTTSRNVTLNFSATDTLSGVGQITFSLDGGLTWSPREDFVSTKDVILPPGDGTKTVKCVFYDKVGNNQTYSDTIVLNTSGT